MVGIIMLLYRSENRAAKVEKAILFPKNLSDYV
jgi:hypothetical protein